MNTSPEEIIGCIAALFSTVSLIPQVTYTWRKKTAESLSWYMLGIAFMASILWLWYGIYLQNSIMLFCNSFVGLLQLCLIFFKLRFSHFSDLLYIKTKVLKKLS